ncbi:MAG TPA: hypothetical protein VLS96_17715 [Nodosilinea sp.]|nr:hypothetical protein [Nodosilinea sp.]
MRIIVVLSLLACIFLSGCEFFTPDTSTALSQSKQIEELQQQTEQLQRQTEAIERLVDTVNPSPTQPLQ